MIANKIKEILAAGFDADVALLKSGLTKEDIKSLADAGDTDANIVLLIGEACHKAEFWLEDFEDEETHEVVRIERRQPLDDYLFEFEPGERDALALKVAEMTPSMDTSRLQCLRSLLSGELPVMDYVTELAKRGDRFALANLGDLYAEGDEDAGFPKDKEKAREYYDKALEAGMDQAAYDLAIEMLDYDPLEHPQDLADDFDPRDVTIMISGHSLYLDQIEYMVEDLTKAHGDSGNELGLFVNLKYLFKTLGFDWVDNTGNLMHLTRHSEPVLTLEIECNPRVDEALVEAFQDAYPKLTVEILDKD